MIIPKIVTLFLMCFVSGCLSKPTTESELLTTGRGIGSTLWGWITYPYTWWSSEPELPPVKDLLIGSTSTYSPRESIEIAKHNVTVWCNDQTCTTMKCDNFGCRNMTCNIYDTDLMGECREYNIVTTPEELVPRPTEAIPKPVEERVTESPPKVPDTTSPVPVTTTQKDGPQVEEYPLELEAVLSSTVNGDDVKSSGDKVTVLNPEQKV